MRNLLLCLGAVYVFAGFYLMIDQKQAALRNGDTVYLELAPRDPRSLMQGDYIALNYAVCNDVAHQVNDYSPDNKRAPSSGEIVISLDNRKVGHFVRLHSDEPLTPQERLVHYRVQGWFASIGAERYFIPEGSGNAFTSAKYGKMKIAPNGTILLVALCDKDLNPITPKESTPQ